MHLRFIAVTQLQLSLVRGRRLPLPHLAWVLLFESRCLLEEEFEGVAELRSSPRPAVLARVNDLPATSKDRQKQCQSSL